VSKLFEELNEAQIQAVKNIEGPSLVIAGAGSGKTRVLTYRIAYLLEKGVAPYSILALTFTNKAAREMTDRIGQLLGSNRTKYLWMGTFHSMFARILRKESDKLGYPSSFSIYDTTDSKSLIKSIIRELNLDEKVYKPGEVLARISSAKNNLITPQLYYNSEDIRKRDHFVRKPMLGEIYKLYASRCKKSGAMDFDDLLLNTNILFRDFPELLRSYQEKFKYILVDEYQDTNYSQYLIVKSLGANHHNVCVVGDDAQSIYSFRGALIENILNFKNDYPSYHLFKLEQNYRSTQNIVDAANSIIEKNHSQIRKTVYSKNESGNKINIVKALTDIEEGFIVSNSILDTMLQERLLYSDFAILYRTNAQSRIFEEALRKRNIPYKIYGSISFYQRKEIKDLISYLRILVNSNDDEALKRIINYPVRGIGNTTLEKLEEIANQNNIGIWQVIDGLRKTPVVFNKGTLNKLFSFADMISGLQIKATDSNAYEVAMNMASASGIMKDLHNGSMPEERSKFENLEELLNGIRDFTESAREEGQPALLENYLENIALLTDADNEKIEDKNKVSIMTVHSAKGLEFSHVYIAGVEEELFPSSMSFDSERDLEEERRLFYVAVTRAKKNVTISYSQLRYKWGVPSNCEPSRFLKDIDEKYIDWQDNRRSKWQKSDMQKGIFEKTFPSNQENPEQYSKELKRKTLQPFNQILPQKRYSVPGQNFNASDPSAIQPGMLVEHQRFGLGKVIHLEGNAPDKKATVFFQEMKQEKQLLLKFAKLRIVDNV